MQDRYVDVQGYHTRYWDEGSGQPLLLIHGLGSSAESWMFNVEELARRYRVLVPDVLGFGKTAKPPANEFTLEGVARFLAGFLESQGVQKAHVAGNSLGGGFSLQFAVDYPAMVDHLVLVDSGGFGREVHWSIRLTSVPLLGNLLAMPSRRNTRMALNIASHRRGFITPEIVDQFYQIALIPENKFYQTAVRKAVGLRGVKVEQLATLQRRMPEITAKTLIMWGLHDQVLPYSHLATARKLLPHAAVHIFEDCGHSPQMEKAAEFNRVIQEFLDS